MYMQGHSFIFNQYFKIFYVVIINIDKATEMSIYSASLKKQKCQNIKFKVLIIGSSGVGKTSLLLKYIKNTFTYDYQVTLGAEYYTKSIKLNDKTVANLQIWDTMGQQAFKAVVRTLYKGVSAIILVYSIDSKSSFNQLPEWVKQIKQSAHKQTAIWLVGAKLDLQDIRQIKRQEGQSYSKSIQAAGFVEVSAKTGQNVKQLFQKLSKYLIKKFNSCEKFRQLIKPSLQQFEKTKSVTLEEVNYRLTLKERRCC